MNGTFYAWSWYLDSVCDDWEILLEGDYESAMILPIKEKYGIAYLSQPILAKQLGVFSVNNLSGKKTLEFLQKIPGKIQWSRLSMNKFNQIQSTDWKETKQKIFELDLILKANQLTQKFSQKILRLVEEGNRDGFSLVKDLSPNDYIKLWKKVNDQTGNAPTSEENTLRRIIAKGIQHRVCKIFGVFSKFNTLVGCGIFFSFQQKITLLSFIQEPDEKDLLPATWMIYTFIQEHAGKNLTLRFELPEFQNANYLRKRQEIRSRELSEIFTGFGAQTFYYPIIESKKPSIWVKLMKPFL